MASLAADVLLNGWSDVVKRSAIIMVCIFFFLGRPFHALMQKMDKLHFNCDEAAPNAALLLHTHCPQAIKEPLVAGIGIIMSVSILCDKKNRSMLRMHPPTGKIT